MILEKQWAYLYVLSLTFPEDGESTSKSKRDFDPAADEALFPIVNRFELALTRRGRVLVSERIIFEEICRSAWYRRSRSFPSYVTKRIWREFWRINFKEAEGSADVLLISSLSRESRIEREVRENLSLSPSSCGGFELMNCLVHWNYC